MVYNQTKKEGLPINRRHHIAPLLIFISISLYLWKGIHHYGKIGDHFYFTLHFLSNRIYFLKNGLFHLPYYAPTFVAGIPIYGNPTDMTFSIVQILFNFIPHPYMALGLSFIFCTLITYAGCYVFYRRFKIEKWASAVGALIFSLNGYIISRWTIGHINFHTYWILPWVLVHLYDLCSNSSVKKNISSCIWMALLFGAAVYGAGITPLLIAGILIVTFILTQLFSGKKDLTWKILSAALGTCVLASLVIASKFLATIDCMAQFPRRMVNEVFSFEKLLWIFPHSLFNPFLKTSSQTPHSLGDWGEFSSYIGLSILICMVMGVAIKIRGRNIFKKSPMGPTINFFILWSVVSGVIVFYLMMGENLGWRLVKDLPILASYHSVQRFIGAMPIIFIGLGMASLSHLATVEKKVFVSIAFAFICIGDILLFHATHDESNYTEMPTLQYPVSVKDLTIREWVRVGDPEKILNGQAGYRSINPMFGYSVATAAVDPGSPPFSKLLDGTYNVNDPVAMIYPNDVNRPPWSRIPGDMEPEKVKKFLSFEDPDFYVPLRQKIANYLSLFIVFASLLALFLLN